MVTCWSRDPDIESFFASKQTFNIFYPKILYVSFSAFNLPGTNLDIISHTSALAFFGKKVLRFLQSQGQAACLMAGLQKKTTYRSMPYPSSGGGARDALQRKATVRAISEIVRETAGWTRPDLTLGTSTSAFIRPLLWSGGPPSISGEGLSFLCSGDGRSFRRHSRWSSRFTQMDPDWWLDVNACFISWMKLRLGPLGLQKD